MVGSTLLPPPHLGVSAYSVNVSRFSTGARRIWWPCSGESVPASTALTAAFGSSRRRTERVTYLTDLSTRFDSPSTVCLPSSRSRLNARASSTGPRSARCRFSTIWTSANVASSAFTTRAGISAKPTAFAARSRRSPATRR